MENRIVLIAVAIFVVAALVPSALDMFSAVDSSGWDTSVASIWDLLPVFAILGMALLFWRSRSGKSS